MRWENLPAVQLTVTALNNLEAASPNAVTTLPISLDILLDAPDDQLKVLQQTAHFVRRHEHWRFDYWLAPQKPANIQAIYSKIKMITIAN